MTGSSRDRHWPVLKVHSCTSPKLSLNVPPNINISSCNQKPVIHVVSETLCFLAPSHPQNKVWLLNNQTHIVLTQFYKLSQWEITNQTCYLTQSQSTETEPVIALILYSQVSGLPFIRISIFKSLVWLSQDLNWGPFTIKAEASTTRVSRVLVSY